MAMLLKLIAAIAVTGTIAIALTTTRTTTTTTVARDETRALPATPKIIRRNRLLSEEMGGRKPRNPNAADHCHKNPEVCSRIGADNNSTTTVCCNNKCVDLDCDHHNCGACGNKCKFSQGCCSGQCVYLSYDKRHCGQCDNSCSGGAYCVFGMCNYA